MIFEVAKVTRPLWSLGRICDEDFEVKFGKEAAFVHMKDGKEVCRSLRLVYSFDEIEEPEL